MAKDKNGREYHFSPFGFCDRYDDTDEAVPESAKKKDDDWYQYVKEDRWD